MERSRFMSCPRSCRVDMREHNSAGLINGKCDTGMEVPMVDVGGYLACGCHASQRDHTCTPLD